MTTYTSDIREMKKLDIHLVELEESKAKIVQNLRKSYLMKNSLKNK